MSVLGENLKKLVAKSGISESSLARKTGVSQPVINRIISGETTNPKMITLKAISDYFGITMNRLVEGSATRFLDKQDEHFKPCSYVPMLTFESVTKWPTLNLDNSFLDKVLVDIHISKQAFALTVEDNTMEPRFPPGTIIVIEPEGEPANFDFVVVHRKAENVVTFKQLLCDGNDRYIKPTNSDFQTLQLKPEDTIIGAMIQAKINFKQPNSD